MTPARRHFEHLLGRLERSPRDADAAFDAADIAIDHRWESDAIIAVARTASTAGSDAQLWQMLGLLHRGLEDSGAALIALARAADIAPFDHGIAHGLARVTSEAGLPSIDRYRRALTLAPGHFETVLGYAAALVQTGRSEDAKACLAGMLEASPGWLAGHQCFARICALEGLVDQATLTLDDALHHAPRDTYLHLLKLEVLAATVTPEEILAKVDVARRLVGDVPSLLRFAGEALSELGRTTDADANFASIEGHAEIPIALTEIRHALRAGRPEEADALAARLVDTEASVTAWAYRSTAWRMLQDPRYEWLSAESLVSVYDIGDQLPSGDGLVDCLRSIHVAGANPLDQSVRGGTQTDGPLFARIDPPIIATRRALMATVDDYWAGLAPEDRAHPTRSIGKSGRPRSSGSWSVRLVNGGHHVAHIHPEGWLSAVLYVEVPDRPDDVAGDLLLGAPPPSLRVALAETRRITPKKGRLVIFPSYMWHATAACSGAERLTIAFDMAAPLA